MSNVENKTEWSIAGLIALLSILTASTAYYSHMEDSNSTHNYFSSQSIIVEANSLYLEANQAIMYDMNSYDSYVIASNDGNESLAMFYFSGLSQSAVDSDNRSTGPFDDQYFEEDWIESIYAIKKPKHYICWYGKIFSNNNLNYWDPIYGMPYILKDNNNNQPILEFHYGATCGCIIDLHIFNDTSELWNIPNDCPVSIYNIEDLWLSFVVSYYYGWNIKRSFLPVNDYTNTTTQENALYLSLRNEKQVLLEYLQKTYKWIT